MTSDHPILFSAPMVRALLDGRKTQTRRLAWRKSKWAPGIECEHGYDACPICDKAKPSLWRRVQPGDRLWVREAWAETSIAPIVETIDRPVPVYRVADNRCDYGGPWKPSIHMPRRASRLTLTVTAVKVMPLQDISEGDAAAEGVARPILPHWPGSPMRSAFRGLWNELHGPDAWNANPEVVALTFTVERRNIDDQ